MDHAEDHVVIVKSIPVKDSDEHLHASNSKMPDKSKINPYQSP